MGESANQPPTDVAELQARLATALAERDAAIAARDEALSQNDRLQHLLHQLQRMQFGRRSEKLDPDQLALAFEDVEQAIAADEAADAKQNEAAARARADKRRSNRGALPAHLPRVHVTIEPEDIIPVRWATSSRYDGRLRQESARWYWESQTFGICKPLALDDGEAALPECHAPGAAVTGGARLHLQARDPFPLSSPPRDTDRMQACSSGAA